MPTKLYYSREEMKKLNISKLASRGVKIDEIVDIAYNQQQKYNKNIKRSDVEESVEKILSLRDIFHLVQLGIEIDRLAEEKLLEGPIQDIIFNDLGVFGVDEIFGLNIANLYGVIGQTNFGDIDVNKPGVVKRLNDEGKPGSPKCHTFLDDIVGAIAASATTRVSQIVSEDEAKREESWNR